MDNEYLYTYRRADGELIDGEFSFVTEPGMLHDLLDPIEVIEERWLLVESITYTTEPAQFTWDEEAEEE